MTSRQGVEPRQTRDVMAFGHEVGRALSDGRVVGRAEPFAKVFPSSRVVKRAVGLASWAVLEDIALDAHLDERGRLVSQTSVRRIAANLGLNKDTVTRHLARLREFGFVLQEERRDGGSGRYEACWYVLDPSACIERFTTPAPRSEASQWPCPKDPDTVAPVSEGTGHGRTGPGRFGREQQDAVTGREEQQQAAGRLIDAGVAAGTARRLAVAHSPGRVAAAVAAASQRAKHNPAGWVVRALDGGWPLPEPQEDRPHRPGTRDRADAAAAAQARAEQQRREGWCAAISAALDDTALVEALRRVTTPAAGVGRRSVPLARAQLIAWAVAAARAHPDVPLTRVLAEALAADATPPTTADKPLPDPPTSPRPPATDAAADLSARIRAVLPRLDQEDCHVR